MESLTNIAHKSLATMRSGQPIGAVMTQPTKVEPSDKERLANHIFRHLMTKYGQTKFLKEFANGRLYSAYEFPHNPHDPRIGQDKGLVAARNAWGETLLKYSLETIEDALGRLKTEFATWPPSLNEFERLCDICVVRDPVPVGTEEERAAAAAKYQAALAESRAARNERLRSDQERLSLNRQARRGNVKASRALLPEEKRPSTMELLQEAVAAALAAQGMDEGLALRVASEKITPEVVASWASGDWRGL